MRALVFKRYGGSEQVAFADTPRPVPKPDEVLIKVHAAGLNPVDNKIRGGAMKPILRFRLPAVLGNDLSGVVADVGEDVKRFKPGDSVFASVDGLRMGALAELACVAESAVALKPANLDFVQAASVPMVGPCKGQGRCRDCVNGIRFTKRGEIG
jgi:NADPH:quinone reductase-like Zn-dependent oxidoreductase